MLLTFSTLEAICLKILGADCKKEKKKFGKQDVVDYTGKNKAELIIQFQTNLHLFQVSKQQMESDFKNSGGFTFPKNFSKEEALNQIDIFAKICAQEKDQRQKQLLLTFCDDFKKLIKGETGALTFESAKVEVQYTPEEQEKFKKMVFKNGMEAAQMMD
jgi:hypothetical protein